MEPPERMEPQQPPEPSPNSQGALSNKSNGCYGGWVSTRHAKGHACRDAFTAHFEFLIHLHVRHSIKSITRGSDLM
ncbi:hypothetical protein BdWA1_000331 [Babesia duncani]|uniref:Uncharacterized protein n=1 Tax=Babesia duncani TaxID=323732 RepID=A0AAD9PM48_9APIC|nr:hypothetical protein BdWA1_000331 [Babesia duncani]